MALSIFEEVFAVSYFLEFALLFLLILAFVVGSSYIGSEMILVSSHRYGPNEDLSFLAHNI